MVRGAVNALGVWSLGVGDSERVSVKTRVCVRACSGATHVSHTADPVYDVKVSVGKYSCTRTCVYMHICDAMACGVMG